MVAISKNEYNEDFEQCALASKTLGMISHPTTKTASENSNHFLIPTKGRMI